MNQSIGKLFRLFPDFKGKRRLASVVFRKLIATGENLIVSGQKSCVFNLPNLKENLSLEVFINGIYEKGTHRFLVERMPENGVYLDLGANIGTIAIPLCKAKPHARCIAVEASPWVFDFLQKNVAANHMNSRVECINRALFEKDNEKVSFFSKKEHFGKGSLAPVFTGDGVSVETITIDTILTERNISQVDLIKIDIEGFEYFAFKGGQHLLERSDAPEILFEFVDWAETHALKAAGKAQVFLKELGYNIYLINDAGVITGESPVLTKGSAMLFATKKYLEY